MNRPLGAIHLRAEISGQNFKPKFQTEFPGQNFWPKFQAKKMCLILFSCLLNNAKCYCSREFSFQFDLKPGKSRLLMIFWHGILASKSQARILAWKTGHNSRPTLVCLIKTKFCLGEWGGVAVAALAGLNLKGPFWMPYSIRFKRFIE